MITKITLANFATYGSKPSTLDELGTVNYFFGSNGAGKTTLSKVINGQGGSDCVVEWQNSRKLEAYVYNRDFVRDVLNDTQVVPGVFTLGKHDGDASAKLASYTAKREKLVDDIRRDEQTFETKLSNRKTLESHFAATCWQSKQNHDGIFKSIMEGHRGSKANFAAKVFGTRKESPNAKIEVLRDRATTLLSEELQRLDRCQPPGELDLTELETNSDWTNPVVGSKDASLAGLIQSLENSDWVKNGQQYLTQSDGSCPFCQQSLQKNFIRQLEEFFDNQFEVRIGKLKASFHKYEGQVDRFLQGIQSAIDNYPSKIAPENKGTLIGNKAELERIFRANLSLMEKKIVEPSLKIELAPSKSSIQLIDNNLSVLNRAIDERNEVFENQEQKREQLTADFWRYLRNVELVTTVDDHGRKIGPLNKAIDSINTRIAEHNQSLHKLNEVIENLERKTTNVKSTVSNINDALSSFGFDSFSIEHIENTLTYRLVRPDKSLVSDTLSEGEKTFIAFQYFVQLVNGSRSVSGALTPRVVVIDDPVSSLDSSVLFIVSRQIRAMVDKVTEGDNVAKQLFLLTHNAYFFKEISFDPKRRGNDPLKKERFFIVRKRDNNSTIERRDTNPVKSSYEMLWDQVSSETDSVTLQNAMRRILEWYFQVIGNTDLNSLHKSFTGNDADVCRSLVSWVHAGSHGIYDEINISTNDYSSDAYKSVFRRIFETHGHSGHYEMMMGTE